MTAARRTAIALVALLATVVATTSVAGAAPADTALAALKARANAQIERRLIQERTKAGLTAARARGRKGGGPAILANDPRVQTAKTLHADKNMPSSARRSRFPGRRCTAT